MHLKTLFQTTGLAGVPKGPIAHKRLRVFVLMADAKACGYSNHTFPIVTGSLRRMRLL